MNIEVASEKDIPSIKKLSNELIQTEIDQELKTRLNSFETKKGDKYLKSFIGKRKKVIYLAKNNTGKIIRYLFAELLDEWWTDEPKKAELVMIIVTKKYRNQGVGTKLIEKQRE